jgi:DNA-nicking Smr family endonuclease|tara:strand:+ start:2600 stop:3016 length:417 start_codon:yes stop_codon:yes gene_type:complete
VKKKNIPSKDLNTWFKFVKNLPNIEDKEKDKKILPTGTKKTLDLHGFSLNEANTAVHETLEDCFFKGIKALKIITGKGSRSKSFNDPYKSKDLSILKNSVPEYIQNSDLKKYVIRITESDPSDGGQGAIYVFLKNKFR